MKNFLRLLIVIGLLVGGLMLRDRLRSGAAHPDTEEESDLEPGDLPGAPAANLPAPNLAPPQAQATPQLLANAVVPKPAPTFADVVPESRNDIAAIFSALGPLANHLVLAYSMDTGRNGSAVYSTNPIHAHSRFLGDRKFVKDNGRQCVNFEQPDTRLDIYGALRLAASFTMTTWAKLPFAGDQAVIWSGMEFTPLRVIKGNFACSRQDESRVFCAYDKTLTGWHHLAITSDAGIVTFYLDGVAKGTAPMEIHDRLTSIGGLPSAQPDTNPQCGLLDDMLFFDRAVTDAEMAALLSVRLPIREPSPQDLASTRPPGFALTPPSPRAAALASRFLREHRESLVFVTGEGAGSGFIANFSGKPFLVTNAHVAAGVRGAVFQTLHGTALKPGAASVAVGHDIFTMQTATSEPPLEVMRDVADNTLVGDEVVVLGNAEGGGVINTITGRIVSIEPNVVEVNAAFLPGNSGSPIVHLRTGKVIAIATYLTIRRYDPTTKKPIQDPIIRRFGYRLDSVKTWQPVDWNSFFAQAAETERVESLTQDFIAFLRDLADDGKMTSGAHSNPSIRGPLNTWLESRSKHLSSKDALAADQNLLAFLKSATQSDIIGVRPKLTYDYFQRKVADQQKERTEIAGVFTRIIDRLGKER